MSRGRKLTRTENAVWLILTVALVALVLLRMPDAIAECEAKGGTWTKGCHGGR